MKSFPSSSHYATFRISIILLRKATSFSENHIENLNHLGKKGTTLKTTFSTDELPLCIHKSQVPEGDYIRPFSNVLSLVSQTLNRSKNKVLHLQRSVNWCWGGRV